MRLSDPCVRMGVYWFNSATLGAVTSARGLPTSSGCRKNWLDRSDMAAGVGSKRVRDLTPASAMFLARMQSATCYVSTADFQRTDFDTKTFQTNYENIR